jgi:hypothetical protein
MIQAEYDFWINFQLGGGAPNECIIPVHEGQDVIGYIVDECKRIHVTVNLSNGLLRSVSCCMGIYCIQFRKVYTMLLWGLKFCLVTVLRTIS